MKRRIVEGPDTTTYYLEYPFHFIKDEKEADNVLKDVTKEQLVVIEQYVDDKTFAPWIAFALKDSDKNLAQSYKYCAKLGTLVNYADILPKLHPNRIVGNNNEV